jgi:hypothetical protein
VNYALGERATDGRTRSRRLVAGPLALLAGYVLLRPRLNNWGATADERDATLPGDELVPRPSYQTTRAVTADAPPEDVWPWLVQLGAGRGGLYSYEWLDVLFGVLDAPSAERILPQHQRLEAGDEISLGVEGGGLLVERVDPERALVTVSEAFTDGTLTWVFALEPLADGRTRLLTRNRARVEWSPRAVLTLVGLEPAAFAMTRKMLLGIKRRAEREAVRIAVGVDADIAGRR